MSCCQITDEEAQNWPLDDIAHYCNECLEFSGWACGYCGTNLCEQLSCIKAHVAKGCYNNHRHALDSQADGHKDPPPKD